MLFKLIIAEIILFTGISCRELSFTPKSTERQLFLSRRVVTENEEFDGGVLVDANGIIEGILKRESVNSLLNNNAGKIKIVDGGDLALMAGIVDSHVHVNEPNRTSWEGFVTATQAAAAGGITTIMDMPLNSIPPTTTLRNLRIKASVAKEEVHVDVGFWGGVIPGNEIELLDLIRAGVVGFKCFLIESGVEEFPNISPDELKTVLAVLNGTGSVLAFHAELQTSDSNSTTCSTDCPDPELYNTYLNSRPDEMEIKAAELIASLLPISDIHVHVVHVSAAAVVPILEKARQERVKSGNRGWRAGVTAETSNHYLTLSSEQIAPGHTEFKCSPPIRNNTNKQQLWEYIRDERLDLIASDHSPSTLDLKGPDFMTAWGGISSVQFDLPLFWTEASARGHSLGKVSNYLSAGPARLCGLQDRKGAIRPGLDADLIFFDPNAAFLVTPEIIRYKNKISPYMNRVLRGKVIETYLRGRLIYSNGMIIGEPQGKLLLNDERGRKIDGESSYIKYIEQYYNLKSNSKTKVDKQSNISTTEKLPTVLGKDKKVLAESLIVSQNNTDIFKNNSILEEHSMITAAPSKLTTIPQRDPKSLPRHKTLRNKGNSIFIFDVYLTAFIIALYNL